MRTNVYVDGFNLYYGALKGTPYKWLDPVALVRRLLPARHDIRRLRYFTAKVDPRPHDPDQPVRQLAYLRALATLPQVSLHYGTFQTKATRLPTRASVDAGVLDFVELLRPEEKGSDVNLASWLLRDAFRDDMECAVVVSNDSDLLTPIRMARWERGTIVGALLPRAGGSLELKSSVDFWKPVRPNAVAACQLNDSLRDLTGDIRKPAAW